MSVLFLLGSTVAGAWEQPSEWADLGQVSMWKQYDARFYRVYDDSPFMDQSQFKLDQTKPYARSREYAGKMDGIGLETFLARDAGEQAKRRKSAAGELKFVIEFRQRMETYIQRSRENAWTGWGAQITDMTVIGDCLGKLRTAVGLDPSNPYAWHLLAYFADIVGDRARAAAALDGAEAALAVIPADELKELRVEVALDKAWLQRDQGRFEAALASLQTAAENGASGTEPHLIQGLIAAQTGKTQIALEIASKLRSSEIRVFPVDYQSTSFSAEMSDVTTWTARNSTYLQSWILALSWLYEGKTDMAAAAFGNYSLKNLYPHARRFWNDAGRIYEMTGRRSLAHKAWSMARISNPYVVYFVYKPYATDLGKLTGRPGAVPYFLGFDTFYLSGNRLAYGASLVEKVAAATDDFEKQKLASRALDELDICQSAGIYAGPAQVLKGQVYYLMGDLGSAQMEVAAALQFMDEQGDKTGIAAVLQGVAKSGSDLAPTDVANFYSQSGSAAGRWMKPEDLEAELAGLRKAYADDPTDANRHDLARFLIRNDDLAEGRDLAMGDLKGQDLGADNIRQLSGDDLELVLEADRAEGEDTLALALVGALKGGSADPWNHSGLWVLTGFICLDGGNLDEGRLALERALELDPGNHGLKIQLALVSEMRAD
ncbi:MAG: hypothetical protein ABFS42_06070 [Candidatus Krumholzibacteriota bacterium]